MGGEVECFSDAPDAHGMTVFPLPVTGGVRGCPMPIGIGQGRPVGECSRSAKGAVTECDPMVRGRDGLRFWAVLELARGDQDHRRSEACPQGTNVRKRGGLLGSDWERGGWQV